MTELEIAEVSASESDGCTWLTIKLPNGASASLSCKSYHDSGETICSQVVKKFASLYVAPPIVMDYIDVIRKENLEAKREARILVKAMAEQAYPDVHGWRPLDDTAGMISQISNMVAGIRDRTGEAEAEKKRLRDPFSDERKFTLGQRVTKTKGSCWTGHIVGFYSTTLTPVGYCVESETEKGSVQLYPEAALAAV